MKFLLLILPISVSANTFQLKDMGARFTLSISPTELSYSSESMSKRLKVRDCNRGLASELNTEIFGKVTQGKSSGLRFLVDGKETRVDHQSDFGMRLLTMESRILEFLVEESQACP